MSKKQFSKSNLENWVVFSQSYFSLAKLACQELLDGKHHADPGPHVPYPYAIHDLYIPMKYNINHGIEIFIKTLLIILGSQYGDSSHDLMKSFCDLKKIINKEKKEIHPKKYSDGNIITQDNINNIPIYLDSIEKIIKKYFYNKFVPKKHVADSSNTIHRYPDNKTGIDLNFIQNILPTIHNKDIKKMQNDIDELIKCFSGLGYMLHVYKNCQ